MSPRDVEPWTLTPAQRFGLVLTLTVAAAFAAVLLAGWATGALAAGGGA